MTTAVIIDIVIVLALAGFTVYGAKRGLFQALAGLVIVLVALVGAAIIAGSFSEPIAQVAAPVVEKHFETQLEEFLTRRLEEAGVSAEENLIGKLPNLTDTFLADVLERGEEQLVDAADSVAALASAAVESLIEVLAYGILFVLAFLLLLLLLRVLCAGMGLLTKLPGVHGMNALGGAAFGLAEGVLLVFLAVYMLRNLGAPLDAASLQEAHILGIFRDNTPLSILLSLL